MDAEAGRLLGAALALLGNAGVGIGLGNVFAAYMNSVARNPSAQPKLQVMTFIGMALIEAMGLFALVISFLILFSK